MLKKISTMAREDCEKFMGTKIYLHDLGQGEGAIGGTTSICIRNFGFDGNG